MNQPAHQLCALFAQMGLPSDEPSIQQFLRSHAPLAGDIALQAAPFWTPAQAAFLAEEMLKDADWAPVIDQLNIGLRAPRS